MQHQKLKRRKLTDEQKELQKLGVKLNPPRKWKQGQKNRWLKKLRDTIRKTQMQFAIMVGEEKKTIINIENGRTRLNEVLAYKIQAATGVSSWKYMQGRNTPLDFSGNSKYTYAHFEHWKKFHCDKDETSINEFVKMARDDLFLMLHAAEKSGSPKNLLPALKLSFHFWCKDIIKKFQLQTALNEILNSKKSATI